MLWLGSWGREKLVRYECQIVCSPLVLEDLSSSVYKIDFRCVAETWENFYTFVEVVEYRVDITNIIPRTEVMARIALFLR